MPLTLLAVWVVVAVVMAEVNEVAAAFWFSQSPLLVAVVVAVMVRVASPVRVLPLPVLVAVVV